MCTLKKMKITPWESTCSIKFPKWWNYIWNSLRKCSTRPDSWIWLIQHDYTELSFLQQFLRVCPLFISRNVSPFSTVVESAKVWRHWKVNLHTSELYRLESNISIISVLKVISHIRLVDLTNTARIYWTYLFLTYSFTSFITSGKKHTIVYGVQYEESLFSTICVSKEKAEEIGK